MKLALILAAIMVLALLIGVPVVMVMWLGRETFRDIVVIAWGGLSVVALLLFIIWILVMWRGISRLVRDVRLVMREDVRPLLATGQESVANVAGTTRFLGEAVVTPVLRVYGILSGVRRAIAVFTGLARRGKRTV